MRIRRAKAICDTCPVQFACLKWAVDTKQPFGVWGGMTERDRRVLLKKSTPLSGAEVPNAEKIIAEQSVVVDIDAIKPYRKNPRVGNLDAIRESVRENGQFRPVVVQKSTGEILGGNHTWKAMKAEGYKNISAVYVDVDDLAAARIVLADNRTNDLATYNTEVLTEILAGLPTPVGTGYDDDSVRALMAGIQDRDADLIQTVVRPPLQVEFDASDDKAPWDLDSNIQQQQERHDARFGDEGNQGIVPQGDIESLRIAESIASLQIQFEQFQDKLWPSSNYWGVPDLRSDMLVSELPDPLKTWGGVDATPDDGVSTYLWNAGLAATKGMPWDRVITTFFTYDTKFENWFEQPAFQVARMIHNGCTRAIVPDTSFWEDDTRFHHLSAAYNANWLARFMQECGVKIIPRLMWADLESIKVGRLGIPKKPPIVAVCIQAISKKEAEKGMSAEGLRLFVKEVEPEALIVYGGGTAKQVTADAHLPKELHVVQVDNYAHVRRGVVFDNPTGKALVDKAARKQNREEKDRAKEEVAS